MKPELIEVRKRLYNDFPFYAKHALKIRTKDGEIVPFKLNHAQAILQKAVEEEVEARGYCRIIVLKARQLGLSTHIGAYLYSRVSQEKARKALVVTHAADSTRALFDMTKRYHDNCPDGLKPSTKYSSRRELSFDILDSSYIVATAGGESIARGETISHSHLSELAFWPTHNARENFNAIMQAVPSAKGTAVFIESTANGVSGLFYELWKGAVDGTNGFRAVFIPWYTDPLYREEITAPFDLTPDEKSLAAKYGLDEGQLAFRRRKIAQNGIDLWNQEYPTEPEDAFLTTGRPVFNPEQLTKRLTETQEPLARLALEGNEWQNNVRGELTQYYKHDPKETYYIGADVAMGIRGGDWSVAQVFDSERRQVATWRGQVHPDYFSDVLYNLGNYYNTARLIVENNSHGILTCTRLGKDYSYENLYMTTEVDKVTERENTTFGFRTTVKTKPLIIDQLRAALRDGIIELNDKTTIREMLTYVVTESGAMEAEQGCFDDCVMALAMVNHIHEGKFTPVEVTDEYYIEAL
jgi:hypothetical protein